MSGGRGPGDVTSVYLDQIGGPAVRPRPDGTGDVRFRAGTVSPPIFIGLANPHEAAALIGDAQVATRAALRPARGG